MDLEFQRYRRDQAERYLKGVRRARRKITALQLEIEDLRDIAAGLRGIDYAKPHVDTQAADNMPDAVAGLIAATDRHRAAIAAYERDIERCDAALDALGGWQADLLRAHWMGGASLADIGRLPEWGHDKDYMSRLHGKALCDLYDFLPPAARDPLHRAV